MALITRVSRLFRADLHAVLDRIEEPDVLLRQAVREMEDDIAGDEQRMKAVRIELDQLRDRRRELDEQLIQIEEELDICFASEKDDLARVMVRRKLEAGRLLKTLARTRENLESESVTLGQRLDDHRGRLSSMRQKAELLAGEGSQPSADVYHASDVRDEDVEVALLREKQQRSAS